MELLVSVAALCIFGMLAMRFGYDSRPRAHSKEQEFAGYGVIWDAYFAHMRDLQHEAAAWRLADQAQLAQRPQRRLYTRRLLARGLRRVAQWLNPDVQVPRGEWQTRHGF